MRQHFLQEILKQLDMDYRPSDMKQVTTLNEFKAKMKIWKLKTVPADSVKLTFHR